MMGVITVVFTIVGATTSLWGSSITPIPSEIKVDEKKVQLGKKLFFDPILSKDGTISCATCHHLQEGGDDNLQFSFGIGGLQGSFNSPTVYNAVFNFRQFWDGHAKDLKEQVYGPVENIAEMGNTMDAVVETLKKDKVYPERFSKIYPDGITKDNVVDAIAEFEKALITPDSPFDKYLKGDDKALTSAEKEGYGLFKSKGCITCHHGVNVGGNHYNKFGVYDENNSTQLGRYNITKREEDKYVFKVPSLRNIELTAPYMHDGRAETLKDAVRLMSKQQLGRHIEEEEIDKIVEFLKTLTGKIPPIAESDHDKK